MTYKQFVITYFETLDISQSIQTGYEFVRGNHTGAEEAKHDASVTQKNIYSLFETLPQ